MKILCLIIALLTFPFLLNAETSMVARKIKDGKVCDTCPVESIANFGEPMSYMILGTWEQNEYLTPNLQKPVNSALPNLSTYLIAAGSFSLDFIPVDFFDTSIFDRDKFIKASEPKIKNLEFSVLKNNHLIKDWTKINTLEADKNFRIGLVETEGSKEQYTIWENRHAGAFQLNINDSLAVLVRSSISKQIIESILIKRIILFPTYFDFIKFPADVLLKDIMYGKYSMSTSGNNTHPDSIDHYEMEPDEILVFRFPDDPRVRTKELEYSFSNEPGKWQQPTIYNEQNTLPGNFSIVIYKPTPGEIREVLLRYKIQPESIHRIIIHVKEKAVGSSWFKILVVLGIATLLFTGWYTFKRKSHQKKMRQLTLDKEETENKLQLLSGQLNPHFLFNSLNSVQNLINKHDTENASLYVSEVAAFLRTIMDTGKKEYVSLEEELSIEEAYMKLEQKRKFFKYSISSNCNTPVSQIEFPPSLLQPVIENCIHHGFSKDIVNPTITISIDCNGKNLIISVTDNGHGFETHSLEAGHGLSLVGKRISLLNDKLSSMTIEMKSASSDKGTVTTFIFQNWL